MTPDDVALDLAAMRGYLGKPANEMGRAMLRVCDALEASWKRIADLETELARS